MTGMKKRASRKSRKEAEMPEMFNSDIHKKLFNNLNDSIRNSGLLPPCDSRIRDPEMWFPIGVRGRDVRIRDAEAVCATCPFQIDCALLGTKEVVGIWGGISVESSGGVKRDLSRAINIRGIEATQNFIAHWMMASIDIPLKFKHSIPNWETLSEYKKYNAFALARFKYLLKNDDSYYKDVVNKNSGSFNRLKTDSEMDNLMSNAFNSAPSLANVMGRIRIGRISAGETEMGAPIYTRSMPSNISVPVSSRGIDDTSLVGTKAWKGKPLEPRNTGFRKTKKVSEDVRVSADDSSESVATFNVSRKEGQEYKDSLDRKNREYLAEIESKYAETLNGTAPKKNYSFIVLRLSEKRKVKDPTGRTWKGFEGSASVEELCEANSKGWRLAKKAQEQDAVIFVYRGKVVAMMSIDNLVPLNGRNWEIIGTPLTEDNPMYGKYMHKDSPVVYTNKNPVLYYTEGSEKD